jgi:dihydroorotate dehydrogenase electron transfer subunit
MKKIAPQQCRVKENRRLDKSGAYYSIKLTGFAPARRVYPGQFVHIRVTGAFDPLFRRAFSIADFNSDFGELEIIYKVVGKGTGILGTKKKNDRIDVLGPLGNRFSTIPKRKTVVIVAGGVGLPPLYFLAKRLIGDGHPGDGILFFYGGRSKADLIAMNRVRALGVDFIPCTDDGSYGFKGFVTEAVMQRLAALKKSRTHICACGPEPMLAAVQESARRTGFVGEMSLEAPMPCGVGVCLGCIKRTTGTPQRYVRVCYDGPVFRLGEVRL